MSKTMLINTVQALVILWP